MEKTEKNIEKGSRVLPGNHGRMPVTVSFDAVQLARIDAIADALDYNRSEVVQKLLAIGLVEHDRTKGKA